MNTRLLYLSLFLFCSTLLLGQNAQISQTIRGKMFDLESKTPLIGVSMALFKDSILLKATSTDANGNYRFEKVAPGRYTIAASYIGYQKIFVPNILVGSGKEIVQDFMMSETYVKAKEVIVTAFRVGEVRNDMATISSKLFSVEETERYAGSRGDPARMASNFAGVQGADDTRNDIVVRGNSPAGVVWRLEGVDIYNPNHFSIPGTTGGSVSILNNKYLGKSDFFTGAFPAEFGNGTAAVFDIFMRNGNNEKHEHSAQIGVLGTEVFSEGPLSSKSKASYLLSYRYSSLALFNGLHFNFGTNAIPYYQDAAFRLNFPLKNNANLAFFALGGSSHIDIKVSNQTKPISDDVYGANDRDQYFASGLGMVGSTYTRAVSKKTFTRVTLAYQGSMVNADHDYVYRHIDSITGNFQLDSLSRMLQYRFRESKLSLAWMMNHKFNARWLLKGGFNLDQNYLKFNDSIKEIDQTSSSFGKWTTRWDNQSAPVLLRVYVQVKFKPSEALTINAGLHNQYYTLNGSKSLFEPRLGLQYVLPNRQTLSFGAGLHSQTQNNYLYYYRLTGVNGVLLQPHNMQMGFTKSWQFVLGYDKMISKALHFHAETYYQYLFQVPIESRNSSFSLLNTGSGFSRFFPDTLVNKGKGQNYGVEFTLDRAFRNRYFFMLTLSLFESKYVGSDGIWRNTEFNGQYALNLLGTKEWQVRGKNTFALGGKLTMAGGRWYGPPDSAQTLIQKDIVYADKTRNTLQFKDYFRFDIKIKYVIAKVKISHEIGLDIVNVFNTKNALKLSYSPSPTNPSQGRIVQENQLGLLPLLYYKIDF